MEKGVASDAFLHFVGVLGPMLEVTLLHRFKKSLQILPPLFALTFESFALRRFLPPVITITDWLTLLTG